MKPLVEGLEKTYGRKIEFRRYNVESDQEGVALAQKLGVQYVPTFLLVTKDGVISKTLVGEQTLKSLTAGVNAIN